MDTFEGVTVHEDLQSDELQDDNWRACSITLSKAVEHERGWVATKMGLFDMFEADVTKDQRCSSMKSSSSIYGDT